MKNALRPGALPFLGLLFLFACRGAPAPGAGSATATASALPSATVDAASIFWNDATVYFLLTDRFANGDTSNDHALGRAQDGAPLRSFMGGDLAGVRQKLDEGYFDALGVDAIWLTPFVEQIHGSVDEGTGKTYAFHGYWTRDWTAVDPALGSYDDLRAMVETAHRRGIRVLMDAVINHPGPVTPIDPAWPDDWVRNDPRCSFRDYAGTVDCKLVATLPDIRTDSDDPVELPPALVDKWRAEGRLAQEQAELDAFFARTGYPRAPRYYIIKWLTDWVRELGFDGYRVDTAKHFEESVSAELKHEAEVAFADWKRSHPTAVLDSLPFFMLGEVYNYDIANGRGFDFGDRTVDFYRYGYDALINFGLKRDGGGPLDDLFSRYASILREGALRGFATLNYIDSHDDGAPLDLERTDPMGDGTRLLLAPGGAQIYYGDETARPLRVEGARGDANLRSFMNWNDLERGGETARVLEHWQKLGRFRHDHPAVGAGAHHEIRANPYVFSRMLDTAGMTDRIVVAMGVVPGTRTIPVGGVFADGTEVVDAYSGVTATVASGAASFPGGADLVLLSERR